MLISCEVWASYHMLKIIDACCIHSENKIAFLNISIIFDILMYLIISPFQPPVQIRSLNVKMEPVSTANIKATDSTTVATTLTRRQVWVLVSSSASSSHASSSLSPSSLYVAVSHEEEGVYNHLLFFFRSNVGNTRRDYHYLYLRMFYLGLKRVILHMYFLWRV